MAGRSIPLHRIDLSYMEPAKALATAMDNSDNATNILFCAGRKDERSRFGAVVKRVDLSAYLSFAIAVEEAGHDIAKQLHVLLKDGVQDQDVNLVIGLIAALARRVWREMRLTVDQIRCASVILSDTANEVSFLEWQRN